MSAASARKSGTHEASAAHGASATHGAHDGGGTGHPPAGVADELARLVEQALQLPEPPASRWHRPGISPRAERWLEVASSLVLGTLATAWLWTIVEAREAGAATVTPTTRAVTAALTRADAPSAAYLSEAALAALGPLRGASGRVRIVQQAPGDSLAATLPAGARVTVRDDSADADPVRDLAVQVGEIVRPVADLQVVRLTPLSARRNGRIGLYYIGQWPTEGRAARTGVTARGDYAPPRGLIEVTRATQDTRLSEHLRIRDFLTHDQANVWPKYVVVQPRLVDKLELVLAELQATHGVDPRGIHVMSGFRTPQYNAGGGNTTGRANLSRHMFGDAADVWIDNDGDGRMDDLDGDGRVDIGDAAAVCAAVERVEQRHPTLVGGCGVYPANPAHGPFAHVDARGYRARWTGSGDGG